MLGRLTATWTLFTASRATTTTHQNRVILEIVRSPYR
jgi:hypothetical protein